MSGIDKEKYDWDNLKRQALAQKEENAKLRKRNDELERGMLVIKHAITDVAPELDKDNTIVFMNTGRFTLIEKVIKKAMQ